MAVRSNTQNYLVMSKGSNRRPKEISDEEFAVKWEAIVWATMDEERGPRHIEAMRTIEKEHRSIINSSYEVSKDKPEGS